MVQNSPRTKGLLDAFKEKAAQRKGRPSIESLAAGAGRGSVGVGPLGRVSKA